MELESNKVICSDYASVLKNVDDKVFDFICIDPPYTNGKKKGKGKRDALSGHKIQTELDLNHVASEMYRVLKDDSFYVFFGQMPTIVEWHLAAVKAGFEFVEHISWIKRANTAICLPIMRGHESIFIYRKGKAKYVKTKGKYEDIKLPLLDVGGISIEGIKRYIGTLRTIIKSGDKGYNCSHKKRNDAFHDQIKTITTRKSKAPEHCNFTNVWSFLPHNKKKKNKSKFNIKHPTVKPIPILERLIELCTHENALVLDCFAGSGTTALACINTKRKYFLVELDKDYCDVINERIGQHNVKSELF